MIPPDKCCLKVPIFWNQPSQLWYSGFCCDPSPSMLALGPSGHHPLPTNTHKHTHTHAHSKTHIVLHWYPASHLNRKFFRVTDCVLVFSLIWPYVSTLLTFINEVLTSAAAHICHYNSSIEIHWALIQLLHWCKEMKLLWMKLWNTLIKGNTATENSFWTFYTHQNNMPGLWYCYWVYYHHSQIF